MPSDFFHFLQQYLKGNPLPGRSSQIKMVPKPLSDNASRRSMNPPPQTHASSVLLLLYPDAEDKINLMLTLRVDSIDHGGQLSLPGGRAEEGESVYETALREAQEEIGIHPEEVIIAGCLSDLYVAHSNNNVTPVIGFLNHRPALNVNPQEVEEAFSITLDRLLCAKSKKTEQWNLRNDEQYQVPFWDVHRVPLWGATAMILSEFLDLYRQYLQQRSKNK